MSKHKHFFSHFHQIGMFWKKGETVLGKPELYQHDKVTNGKTNVNIYKGRCPDSQLNISQNQKKEFVTMQDRMLQLKNSNSKWQRRRCTKHVFWKLEAWRIGKNQILKMRRSTAELKIRQRTVSVILLSSVPRKLNLISLTQSNFEWCTFLMRSRNFKVKR